MKVDVEQCVNIINEMESTIYVSPQMQKCIAVMRQEWVGISLVKVVEFQSMAGETKRFSEQKD